MTEEMTAPGAPLTLPRITLSGITYEGPIEADFGFYPTEDLMGPDVTKIAVVLYTFEDGLVERLATVSTNIVGETPAAGCIFVKNYSEGSGMLDQLVNAGWLRATGRQVGSGYVNVPEAEIVGPLKAFVDAQIALRVGNV